MIRPALAFLRARWADIAFVVLSLAIVAWVAWDAFDYRLITYSPGADYWEHTAVLRALLEDPFHPEHPLIETQASSPRFGPHFLLVALVGRAFGTDALGAMSIAAVLNAALFVTGIYVFFREYFRDPRAPLVGLVVMFGTWLDAPHFSNVYKLSIYFSVAGYPSSAALAVMLFALAALLRVLRSERERPALWALVAFLGAYVYVTHPLTAMLAFTAAGLLVLTEPSIAGKRRLWGLGALAAGVLLASLWPYYPALGMVASGTADRVQKGLETGVRGLHPFYEREKLFGILGFGLLAVPLFPYFVWKRRHLVVPLGALVMLAVFGASALLDVPLGHRFALLAVFFLQIGVVWLLLAALGSPRRAAGEPALRYGARLAGLAGAAGLLVTMAVMNVDDASERFARRRGGNGESSTVIYARRVGELAGPNAVVLADPLASWSIPTFGPKIVTLHHGNPLTDGAEREAASRRFFGAKTPAAERRAILERYHVTHVVTLPKTSPAALRYLEANGQRHALPLGRALFTLEHESKSRDARR
ncbi:MAG TPA: hypothetical protein VFZ53_11005 [Polyangiaceae bacterium]